MTTEWTDDALGRHADYSNSPLWGHIAEDDWGFLLLPAWWWNRHKNPDGGGWWDRRLNLRNPLHWAPYLRSRLQHRCAMVE